MSEVFLNTLKRLAAGLAGQFGEHCETVIYELKEKSASVLWIENAGVSEKKVGDTPLKATLAFLEERDNPPKDRISYLARTENGRILKCSSVFIPDEEGQMRYLFSIHYDITNLLAMEKELLLLTDCDMSDKKKDVSWKEEKRERNVNTLLDELIEQSVRLVGVPVPLMTKQDKIKAINYLNEAGAFLITKSGDKVAKYFGISKYTLYSYVEINK